MMTQYYCYKSDCPIRTEKEPWPRSDYDIRNKKPICKHCGRQMTAVSSAKDHNGEYI